MKEWAQWKANATRRRKYKDHEKQQKADNYDAEKRKKKYQNEKGPEKRQKRYENEKRLKKEFKKMKNGIVGDHLEDARETNSKGLHNFKSIHQKQCLYNSCESVTCSCLD